MELNVIGGGGANSAPKAKDSIIGTKHPNAFKVLDHVKDYKVGTY